MRNSLVIATLAALLACSHAAPSPATNNLADIANLQLSPGTITGLSPIIGGLSPTPSPSPSPSPKGGILTQLSPGSILQLSPSFSPVISAPPVMNPSPPATTPSPPSSPPTTTAPPPPTTSNSPPPATTPPPPSPSNSPPATAPAPPPVTVPAPAPGKGTATSVPSPAPAPTPASAPAPQPSVTATSITGSYNDTTGYPVEVQCSALTDTVFEGADLKTVSATSAGDCCAACQQTNDYVSQSGGSIATDGCGGWTYLYTTVKGKSPGCYLKKAGGGWSTTPATSMRRRLMATAPLAISGTVSAVGGLGKNTTVVTTVYNTITNTYNSVVIQCSGSSICAYNSCNGNGNCNIQQTCNGNGNCSPCAGNQNCNTNNYVPYTYGGSTPKTPSTYTPPGSPYVAPAVCPATCVDQYSSVDSVLAKEILSLQQRVSALESKLNGMSG